MPSNDQDEILIDAEYKDESELQINDVHVSDLDTNKLHQSESKNRDDQIVDISDDEDCVGNDNPIELSDDEEFVNSADNASEFVFRSGELYKCELCGELFIDQNTMNGHKEMHKGEFFR